MGGNWPKHGGVARGGLGVSASTCGLDRQTSNLGGIGHLIRILRLALIVPGSLVGTGGGLGPRALTHRTGGLVCHAPPIQGQEGKTRLTGRPRVALRRNPCGLDPPFCQASRLRR